MNFLVVLFWIFVGIWIICFGGWLYTLITGKRDAMFALIYSELFYALVINIIALLIEIMT